MVSFLVPFLLTGAITQQVWTPNRLLQLIDSGAPVETTVADEIAGWFGEASLDNGAEPKVEGLTVAWAIRVPDGAKGAEVTSVPEGFRLSLIQMGSGRLFVGAAKLPESGSFRWTYLVDGQAVGDAREVVVGAALSAPKAEKRVPAGLVKKQVPVTSMVFGGTTHDWWVYRPANYDPDKESALVVFLDGQVAKDIAPAYFDQLIARGELPQTIVVFVAPGTTTEAMSNRAQEYDGSDDLYVRFLLQDVLPHVEPTFRLSEDPAKRCIAGMGSSGVGAFSCAWNRPDQFGLVMNWNADVEDIAPSAAEPEKSRNYAELVRTSPRKPIRVFLQKGEGSGSHGNGTLSAGRMHKALEFARYAVKAVTGKGFQEKSGGASLAEALRWLFKS